MQFSDGNFIVRLWLCRCSIYKELHNDDNTKLVKVKNTTYKAYAINILVETNNHPNIRQPSVIHDHEYRPTKHFMVRILKIASTFVSGG